jgi:hypothetical protein
LYASQLRLKLGESRDSVGRFNQPLDQATSSSPEALQFLALAACGKSSRTSPKHVTYEMFQTS